LTQTLQVESNPDGSPSLVCRFQKSGTSDRWENQWLVRRSDEDFLLLSSVEGDDGSNWPPSPPFQDLSKEDLGHTIAVMGVGMAGKSHWSVAVSQEKNCLVADYACLVKQSPQFLGSSWNLHGSVESVDGSSIELRIGAELVKLFVRENSNPASFEVRDNKIVMSAINQTGKIEARGLSVRWSFEASFSNPPS
jgi:hypothetical protein